MTQAVQGSTPQLADVARAEEARRKTMKASGKSYTNDDLRRVQGRGTLAGSCSGLERWYAQPAPAAKPNSNRYAETCWRAGGDEKYWRAQGITGIRESAARNKVLLEALQSSASTR